RRPRRGGCPACGRAACGRGLRARGVRVRRRVELAARRAASSARASVTARLLATNRAGTYREKRGNQRIPTRDEQLQTGAWGTLRPWRPAARRPARFRQTQDYPEEFSSYEDFYRSSSVKVFATRKVFVVIFHD